MKRHVFKHGFAVLLSFLFSHFVFAQVRGEEKIVFDFQCKAELESVSFGGTDTEGYITIHHDYEPFKSFVAPHWKKGNAEFAPVGYVAGQKAQVSAIFNFACEKIAEYKVFAKGTGPNNIEFEEQALTFTGNKGNYDLKKSNKAFTDKTVDYFEKFEIKWQVKIGDGKWEDAGSSINPLYVPLSKLNGCNLENPFNGLDWENIYYSVIHYACKPAKGLTDFDKITSSIYSTFKSKKIPRIDKPTNFGSLGMTYWGTKNPFNNNNTCRGLKALLSKEDARCGEWGSFFKYCLAMHGIQGCDGEIDTDIIPDATFKKFEDDFYSKFNLLPLSQGKYGSRKVFLVKNWLSLTNSNLYMVNQIWPYYPIASPLITANGSVINIGDTDGVGAQGINDPDSVFSDHVTVCLGNQIYDPSYGTGPFDGINDWEKNSLSAHAIYTTIKNPANMQKYTLVWILEQELPTINQVIYKCQ